MGKGRKRKRNEASWKPVDTRVNHTILSKLDRSDRKHLLGIAVVSRAMVFMQ